MVKKLQHRKFGRSKRWQVDCDYIEKLSPAEKAFLEAFVDEYYMNEFYSKRNTAPILTQEQAKERAWDHYRASHDVQNIAGTLIDTQIQQTSSDDPETEFLVKEEIELAIAAKEEARRIRHNEKRNLSRRNKNKTGTEKT